MAVSLPPDAEDGLLFSSLESEEADTIRRISINDPAATDLTLYSGSTSSLNERGWRRLGEIVARAKHLQATSISLSGVDNQLLTGFFAGLQLNHSVRRIYLSHCHLAGLRQLSPFLENNGNLEMLSLEACNLDAAALDLLSSSLLERPGDGLYTINLSRNNLGDLDLDKFVDALNGHQKLLTIDLDETGIGARGCASLARLLSNPHSKLCYLYLRDNSIDDDAVSILVESLANDTELERLHLAGNRGITAASWSMLLKLVNNTSSIADVVKSSHCLIDLGLDSNADKAAVERALGVDDANLLLASLEVNGLWRYESDRTPKINKCKMIWAHGRGDLNIGESSIDDVFLPRILGWFADDSSEANASLIQYHDPPLPEAEIRNVRLGSLYRIVRARPALFEDESKKEIKSKSDVLCVDVKKRKYDTCSRGKVKLPPLPPRPRLRK